MTGVNSRRHATVQKTSHSLKASQQDDRNPVNLSAMIVSGALVAVIRCDVLEYNSSRLATFAVKVGSSWPAPSLNCLVANARLAGTVSILV